ncbi:MAG TPA: AAA domain-containing protein [Fluviicola sp.]|nr:AAA domain-containing protein [Fluviicola sp.]
MDFAEQLQQAVIAEKKELNETFEEQQRLSEAEQRKLGILLYPVSILSQETVGSWSVIAFRTSYPINDSYFRKGCSVRCVQGNWSAEGRLQELDYTTGIFSLLEDDVPNLRDEPVMIQFVPDDKTIRCMELGCKLMKDHPQVESFLAFLEGEELSLAAPFDHPDLNEKQQLAVGRILGTDPAVLIQGPPGTGKTRTLSVAVQELINRGKKIVISAPSNTAVDHLCHLLLDRNIPILRLGNEEKMSDRVMPYTLDGYLENGSDKKLLDHLRTSLRKAENTANKHIRNYTREAADEKREARKECSLLRKEIRKVGQDAKKQLLESIPVIAGTPVGLFNELPKTFLTDLVIVDEAGQCLEPLAWLAASFGKRLVLCGDPQQLPPTVFSQKAKQLGLEKSLLERAMQFFPSTLLDMQYRMSPEIVSSINPFFYDNQLQTFHTDRSGELRFVDMAGFGDGEQEDESSGSIFNSDEAATVKRITEVLSIPPVNTIILSPYNAQLGLLKIALPGFRISTIDSVQGQEEDTIIISLTRSNFDQSIGFLKDYRRTNVSISRARTQCVIIGDSATLGNDPFYKQLLDFIEANGIYQSAWEYVECRDSNL